MLYNMYSTYDIHMIYNIFWMIIHMIYNLDMLYNMDIYIYIFWMLYPMSIFGSIHLQHWYPNYKTKPKNLYPYSGCNIQNTYP